MFNMIRGAAVAIPAAAMLASHYLPWRKAIGRDLHRLEAYTIGTAAIVGTSVSLLSAAEEAGVAVSPRQCGQVVSLSAVGAGLATVTAWLADWLIEWRHRRLDLADRRDHAD